LIAQTAKIIVEKKHLQLKELQNKGFLCKEKALWVSGLLINGNLTETYGHVMSVLVKVPVDPTVIL
jgi:hypothetical protein